MHLETMIFNMNILNMQFILPLHITNASNQKHCNECFRMFMFMLTIVRKHWNSNRKYSSRKCKVNKCYCKISYLHLENADFVSGYFTIIVHWKLTIKKNVFGHLYLKPSPVLDDRKFTSTCVHLDAKASNWYINIEWIANELYLRLYLKPFKAFEVEAFIRNFQWMFFS